MTIKFQAYQTMGVAVGNAKAVSNLTLELPDEFALFDLVGSVSISTQTSRRVGEVYETYVQYGSLDKELRGLASEKRAAVSAHVRTVRQVLTEVI
jgi:hypothetical protein